MKLGAFVQKKPAALREIARQWRIIFAPESSYECPRNHTPTPRCVNAPLRVRRQKWGVSPTTRWNERVK
jgi:hypothetical protein